MERPMLSIGSDSDRGQAEDEEPGESGREERLDTSEEWTRHKKHVFIFSNAGKPVYSRHGDEQQLCGFMGLLQALISVSLDSDDPLKCVIAGEYRFVFLLKGALYFVMVTRGLEPESAMLMQLERLYDRIIANLTGAIHKLYKAKPELDIRDTLKGVGRTFNELVRKMAVDPSFFLSSFPTLAMPRYVRQDLEDILQMYRPRDALFALVVSDGKLVHYLRPAGHQLEPEDINMILSLSYCKSYSPYERWMPLCLPHFNTSGYLFTYIGYVMPSVCLLFLSTEKDPQSFYRCSEARGYIKKALQRSQLYQGIGRCVNSANITLETMGLGNVQNVRHFLFKHIKYKQWTSLQLQMPYESEEQQERLLVLYQNLYYRLERKRFEEEGEEASSWLSGGSPREQLPPVVNNNATPELERRRDASGVGNGSSSEPSSSSALTLANRNGMASLTDVDALKMIWHVSESEAVLCIWSSADFVLFVTIDPLASGSKVLPFYFSESVLQWIVREEESLFLDTSSNTWKP